MKNRRLHLIFFLLEQEDQFSRNKNQSLSKEPKFQVYLWNRSARLTDDNLFSPAKIGY